MNTPQLSSLALSINAEGLNKFDIAELDAQLNSEAFKNKTNLIWLHFSGDINKTENWLQQHGLMSETAIEVLCTEFTRPRFHIDSDKHIFFTLRTTRQTPQHPLDYMSLRLYTKDNLVVSVSLRNNDIVEALLDAYDLPSYPTTHRLLMALSHFVADDFTDFITALDEDINALEDSWEEKRKVDLDELIFVRQQVTRLSRYMTPQLEAAQKLAQHIEYQERDEAEKLFHQEYWPTVQNSIKRDIEALAEMRERLSILQETLQQHSSDKINRTMYMLSLVATFFLPLTFVTGLLGMNVGGIPASANHLGFLAVCALMAIMGIIQWVLFKRWQWLK